MGTRKKVTRLCSMAMGVYGIAMSVLGVVIVGISNEMLLTLSDSAMIISTNFFGFLIFVFFGGAISERYGKIRMLKIALAGVAVFAVVFAVSRQIEMLLCSIFFLGGFGGIIESAGSSLIAYVNPEKTSHYVNLAQVFLCAGAVVGPIVSSVFITYGIGWQKAYYLISWFAVLCLLLFLNVKNEKMSMHNRLSWMPLKQIGRNTRFLLICLCMLLYTGTEVSVWGWLSTFLTMEANLTLLSSGIVTGLFFLSMMIGRLISGRLLRYYNIASLVIGLSGISFVAIIAISLIRGETLMFFAVCILGLSLASLYPFILSIGGKIVPNTLGYALLVGSGGVGTVVVPWAVGIFGDMVNMRMSIAATSVSFVLIAVVIFALRRKTSLQKGIIEEET